MPQQQQSVEAQNEAVFRTMILPHVQRLVNETPEITELRGSAFAGLIDHGDITPWSLGTVVATRCVQSIRRILYKW